MIDITVVISLHYKETGETVLFTLSCKKTVEDSNKENLKVITNTLLNKSGNPESLKK